MRKILAAHYVHRNQSELIKFTIRERGRHRIIDKVTAALNDRTDVYEAEFANLGIKGVIVEPATIKAHQKLLVGGVWCICDIEYFHSEDARVVPWILGSIKPIQLSNFDFEGYLTARREFTTEEWIDLLVQYSATLVRSTCGTKYSGSALSSTTTLVSWSDSSAPNSLHRSRTSSGPIRFIGGASITTPSTPPSLGATRSVRYT